GDRLSEVGDEIVDRLDAHREADEPRGRRELCPPDRSVRHRQRELDERLDAAERFGEGEDLGPCGDTLGGRFAAAQLERKHPAERAHLTSRECPPRYFVVEWSTRSAPSLVGCCRYGLANVLSTTASACALCAISASPAISSTLRSGFDGVSIQTSLVRARTARRTASSLR